MTQIIVQVSQEKPLRGKVFVPGDKSISHRALMLGSLAEGVTTIKNLLEAEDVLCTADIMRALGVNIRRMGSIWRVEGRGISNLTQPNKILYCGNSGTTLRLMTGLLSGLAFRSELTGDTSLNARPMGRVIDPLQKMGAKIEEKREGQRRKIIVKGGPLRGGTFDLKVASAQLKSSLLLAGLTSHQQVIVTEPLRSRDHSERMFKAFGADLEVKNLKVTLFPGAPLKGQKLVIPGDFSSAAFFIVLGLISRHHKTELKIFNVGMNPTRLGALEILKKMGAKIRVVLPRNVCGEPVADLIVKPSPLKGIKIPIAMMPTLIDEVPILAIAAALAKGKTVIRGAEELRIKETDRIKALVKELPKFGIRVKEFSDGLEITGNPNPKGAVCQSYGDHRIAMSWAILGTVAQGETRIQDTDCIATSFPNFVPLFKKIGGRVSN